MALELVGGALLSAFLQVAFEKLASPQVLDFFRGSKFDDKLLSKLEIKLHSIQALADDAEQKQFKDQHIRNWLLKVKDVVLDAEDLLDEIQCELSKREDEAEAESEFQTCSGCTCKVPNFFKSSPVRSFHKEIKSRMEEVLDSLEILLGEQGPLGLRHASGVASGLGSEVSQKSQSTSLLRESVIYGRDDDKQIIFNWLTSDTDNHSKVSVLSIVGMGGVGKTTLAQHVYNDSMIQGKFDVKAWVCVSDDFAAFNVTRAILEVITKSTDDSRNLQMVHERLEESLKGKKFLLVLDDVWNEKIEEWEAVQTPLVNFGAQGSRILVTTRSNRVASTMGSKEHHLEQLQKDYCWKLFAQHAFQNANPRPHPHFEEIGMKIVEKCEGLPLALKTVGILLNNKSVPEWTRVLQSEIWELGNNDIVPALALSYHHLPSHLKRCFAYCALFPKDYLFDREFLIQFWMAQKFLQCPRQSMSLEEVGEQYFNDLLSRSFFQQSNQEDETNCFVMHDLLNDLAKYVCGDICFRLEDDQTKSIPKATRHFSIAINHVTYFDGFGTLYDAKKLRAFVPTTVGGDFYFSWACMMTKDELFSKFKFIRILSLDSYSHLSKVPDSIGNLKHLCSLDLSRTHIEELSESIFSLYNLQILKLNKCLHLKELPSNLLKLTNLRRLELIGTELRKVPAQAHLGKLKNVQVLLRSFDVGKNSGFNIQQLGELNLRGRLSIRKLENIHDPSDASPMKLNNKTHLVELKLKWDSSQNPDDATKERDEIVIENLQPSKHLEKLSINNYAGKKLPSWLGDNTLLNVVSLKLLNCKYCEFLPPLGLLPFLKDLKVKGFNGIVSIEAGFYGNSSCPFPSLETLKFSSMEEWEKWECPAVINAFPHLKHLCVKNCVKLKGNLPEQLHNLKKLQIDGCYQLVASTSLERLAEKGHNMLQFVEIEYCWRINFPMSGHYNFLVHLSITAGCDSLTTFVLDIFPTLKLLYLAYCHNLKTISQGNAHNHLTRMGIVGCRELESLPKHMDIFLPSLDSLNLDNCPKVEWLPEGSSRSNLKSLRLVGCTKVFTTLLKGELGGISSLKSLDIEGLEVESFPDQGLLPLSLTSLSVCRWPNLRKLDYKGLCYLSSLKKLSLHECPRLKCLPDEGLPSSISRLRISSSPLLKERCKKGGQDWPKIAHITDMDLYLSWSSCAYFTKTILQKDGLYPVPIVSSSVGSAETLVDQDAGEQGPADAVAMAVSSDSSFEGESVDTNGSSNSRESMNTILAAGLSREGSVVSL